jgi:hypothetical protein
VAHTTADELTYVSFPIEKFEENEDGLIVTGKATDGSVDSDRQIVDPTWSAKALAEWHDTGGNLRVMHNPGLYPAGRSLKIETSPDGHTVQALVVEDTAKKLVKNRVLRAYSIGIAEPVIDRDMTGKAPGGIIRSGRIVELSLVDRPANKNCQLTLAKADGVSTEWSYGDLDALLEKAEAAKAEEQPGEAAHDPSNPNAPSDGEEVDQSSVVKGEGDGGQAGGEGGGTEGAQGAPADADQSDSGGDDDGGEAVKMAGQAYRTARKEWLAREPGTKGVTGGTEYLARRAEWHRWNAEGEAEGLDGTREGAERWLAKHSPAPEIAKTEAGPADDVAKRDFSAAERRSAADTGAAMSDGSFPIKTREDLKNAIHLAGHAKDPGKARAHIKARAAALGASDMIPDSWKVDNPGAGEPLEDLITKGAVTLEVACAMLGKLEIQKAIELPADGAAKADGAVAPGKTKCGTCSGSGSIKDGNMTCPDCKGKGKMKPKKAAKAAALAAVAEMVAKSVAAGLISEKAAQDILHQVQPEGGFLHQSGRRPLPGDVAAVAHHREPDGSSGVEQFEHDSGLPTQADAVADRVPASVDALQMKSDAPYSVARMHDALCAAWPGDAVLSDYPSLKSAADAVDADWFTAQAVAATAAGKSDAPMLTTLAECARAVKSMDVAVVADGRADLHKAFSDMYPSERIRPSDPRRPGSFQRPYLSAGHAAEHAGGSTNVPPSTDTPSPDQFRRGYLTEGHAAPSPADNGPNNRAAPVTASARTYYTTSAKEQARVAMQAMHDHIAANHPELCPMAPSKSVMPPDLGAKNVPQPHAPMAMGGVGGVGKGADASANGALEAQNEQAFGRAKPPKNRKKKLSKSEFLSYAQRHGLAVVPADGGPVSVPVPQPSPDPVAVKALVAEQLTPLTEHYEQQIAELRRQVDKLGSQPDPAMAPVRGPMARPGATGAAPVEKRSLVDEARERADHMAAAERRDFMAYVEMQSRSPDPKVREKALAIIEKMDATVPA